MKELWYDIEDFVNYKISNFGRILNIRTNELVPVKLIDNRHCFVNLKKDGKLHSMKVSVLVLRNIMNIRKSTYYVMYRDNNPYNCSIDNIYEIHSSYRTRRKLDKEVVIQIYKELKKSRSIKELADIYDLPTRTITNIKNKKSYKEITDYIDLQDNINKGILPDLLKF